jgi:hypothetical protein
MTIETEHGTAEAIKCHSQKLEVHSLAEAAEQVGRTFIELCQLYQSQHPELSDQQVLKIVRNTPEGELALRTYGEAHASRFHQSAKPKVTTNGVVRNVSDAVLQLAKDYMDRTGETDLSKAAAIVLSEDPNLANAYCRPVGITVREDV